MGMDPHNQDDLPAAPDFADSVEIVFHNVTFIVTISTINGDTLCIEAEQKSDASRWRGEFTSRYIEDITSKTGNFKKFPVFVKMLLSAVKQQSDSVFVDLLTYQDLELLKSRKGSKPGGAAAGGAAAGRPLARNNKRYMILTYAAEFDRVHYPLPLLYEDNPDPEQLKAVIRQLRAQLDAGSYQQQQEHGGGPRRDAADAAAAEMRRLREENQMLKKQIKLSGGLTDRGQDKSQEAINEVTKDRDVLRARLDIAEAELERERGLHRRELRRKAKELQEISSELQQTREALRDMRLKCKELTGELETAQRGARQQLQQQQDRSRWAHPGYPGHSKYPNPYRAPQPGSRSTSQRNSPASSRNASPLHGRNSWSADRDRAPSTERSRPSSAPSPRPPTGPRFDPTEYVKQKRERERTQAERARRGPTPPPRSAASSPGGSRQPSRSGSIERSRPPPGGDRGSGLPPFHEQRGSAVGSSRPSSAERGRAAPQRSGSPYISPAAGRRSGAPARSSGAAQRATAAADVAGERPFNSRASSPGKALMDVKQTLKRYVQKQAATATTAAAALPRPVDDSQQNDKRPSVFEDATAEIADIDSRLHALQNFLKMAKGAGS